mgnify:CR=1 FL=1
MRVSKIPEGMAKGADDELAEAAGTGPSGAPAWKRSLKSSPCSGRSSPGSWSWVGRV